jgi:glycopeptide antibiotics resistance protein
MLSKFGPSTNLAIILGMVLAVLAFIPMAAIRYRRAGRLRLLDLAMLLGCAVYFMALWTYTLIPIPETLDYKCVSPNLQPFRFIADIEKSAAKAGGLRLNNPDLLQVVFNVIFFMPLGAFIRLIFRRGAILATAIGLLISSIIEVTQLTGIYGIFPCAYRFFDVDDLSMNTLGALLGSLLILPIARLFHGRPVVKAARVTAGRRIVGAIADVMVVGFLTAPTIIFWQVVQIYLLPETWPLPYPALDQVIDLIPAILVEVLWVLIDGRTCGEAIVDLRPVEGSRSLLRRLAKFCSGVGMFLALAALSFPYALLILAAFCLVSLLFIIYTRDHRGLSGLVSGLPMGIDPEKPAVDVGLTNSPNSSD